MRINRRGHQLRYRQYTSSTRYNYGLPRKRRRCRRHVGSRAGLINRSGCSHGLVNRYSHGSTRKGRTDGLDPMAMAASVVEVDDTVGQDLVSSLDDPHNDVLPPVADLLAVLVGGELEVPANSLVHYTDPPQQHPTEDEDVAVPETSLRIVGHVDTASVHHGLERNREMLRRLQ